MNFYGDQTCKHSFFVLSHLCLYCCFRQRSKNNRKLSFLSIWAVFTHAYSRFIQYRAIRTTRIFSSWVMMKWLIIFIAVLQSSPSLYITPISTCVFKSSDKGSVWSLPGCDSAPSWAKDALRIKSTLVFDFVGDLKMTSHFSKATFSGKAKILKILITVWGFWIF